MVAGILKKVFGTKQDRDLKAIKPILNQVNSFAEKLSQLSDEELQQQKLGHWGCGVFGGDRQLKRWLSFTYFH